MTPQVYMMKNLSPGDIQNLKNADGKVRLLDDFLKENRVHLREMHNDIMKTIFITVVDQILTSPILKGNVLDNLVKKQSGTGTSAQEDVGKIHKSDFIWKI